MEIIYKILKYKNLPENDVNSQHKLLRICFGYNLDPNLQDETILINCYYKKFLIGTVSCLNNQILKNFIHNKDYYILSDKKGCYLYNLCTLTSCRKRGIASKLVKKMLEYIKKLGFDYCYTHIEDSNIGSIKTFESNNFIQYKEFINKEDNKLYYLYLYKFNNIL